MATEQERHTVQRLLPRHFKILEMVKAGHSNTVVADTLGIHRDTVGYVTRSPLFQAELTRRRKEDKTEEILGLDREAVVGKARSILEQSVEAAAQKHVELLETDDPALQLRSADKILDRVFGKAEDRASKPVVSLSAEHVQLLIVALEESPHGEEQEPATNGEVACNPQDGQEHVHEGAERRLESSRSG